MPILNFEVESAEAVPFAAEPTIGFQLRVTNEKADEAVQSVALRCPDSDRGGAAALQIR